MADPAFESRHLLCGGTNGDPLGYQRHELLVLIETLNELFSCLREYLVLTLRDLADLRAYGGQVLEALNVLC